jgi:WD40 repeat protein
MVKFYVKSALSVFICAPVFAAEHSLKCIRTLPVEHTQTNGFALQYCYRWLDNQRVFTHKAGMHKRVWDIHTGDWVRATFDTKDWKTYSELVEEEQRNFQLQKKINHKMQLIDLQTYRKVNNTPQDQYPVVLENWWEQYSIQPHRKRHYLRPDGNQYAIVEFEKETGSKAKAADFYIYRLETLRINDMKTQLTIKEFTTKAYYDLPIIPSLKFDWSPNSHYLAVVDTFHRWNAHTGRQTITPEIINIYQPNNNFELDKLIPIETGRIKEISISPDSQWLAAYSAQSFQEKQAIRIWNIMHGYLAATLADEHYGKRDVLDGQEHTSLSNIWSPDSTKIATYDADGNNLNIRQLSNVLEGQR